MKKKHIVRLTDEERDFAYSVLESKATDGIRKRALTLIMLDEKAEEPEPYARIADKCNVSVASVFNIARDYCEYGIEKTLSRGKYVKAPREFIVTDEIEAKLVALAHTAPPLGRSRWSARLLAETMGRLGIVPSISRDTVWRALKKLNNDLVRNGNAQK
jgi:hypothetical protein